MGNSIGLLLLLQVVLIALNAVFASAEIAVISVNDTKMERLAEEGDTRAKRLLKLTQEPAKFPGDDSGCHHIVRIPGKCVRGG